MRGPRGFARGTDEEPAWSTLLSQGRLLLVLGEGLEIKSTKLLPWGGWELWLWSTSTSAKLASGTSCCSLFWEIEKKSRFLKKSVWIKKNKN